MLDREPASSDFLSEVIAGLSHHRARLPCKFFYDERGAALFQKICDLPEYYITRTELQILRLQGAAMAAALGTQIELIGLGTGAGTKTRILLEELEAPAVYIPIDISKEQLQKSTALFRSFSRAWKSFPVCADYLQPFRAAVPARKPSRAKSFTFPDQPSATSSRRKLSNSCGALSIFAGPAADCSSASILQKDPRCSRTRLQRQRRA